MIASTRDFIKNQNDLTRKLEVANEELQHKDQLKDEFIDIAAHELRAPIQPILCLAEVLRHRITSGGLGDGSSSTDSSVSKQDVEHIDIIIRNAKRLIRLEQNILDMTKIESKSLKLDKERFDLVE